MEPCCCGHNICKLHSTITIEEPPVLQIGCHVPIMEGSVVNTLKMARGFGMTTCQLFIGNPMSYGVKNMQSEVEAVVKYQRETPMKFFVHAPYIVNLASDNPSTKEKSTDCLQTMLRSLNKMDCAVVLHTGARGSLQDVADQINKLVYDVNTPPVLLENSDGAGTKLGKNYEELRKIAEGVDKSFKLGFCIDTAHLYTCGENQFDTDSSAESVVEFLHEYKHKLIHLNDSKTCFCSHKDNHQSLCQGCIWSKNKDSLEMLLHTAFADRVPMVLETPSSLNDLKMISTITGNL